MKHWEWWEQVILALTTIACLAIVAYAVWGF